MTNQVIPEAAVEAAARALYSGAPIYDEERGVITGYKPWESAEPAYQEHMLNEARSALEAAAPHMLAEAKADAWDEGRVVGSDEERSGYATEDNPYRSQG